METLRCFRTIPSCSNIYSLGLSLLWLDFCIRNYKYPGEVGGTFFQKAKQQRHVWPTLGDKLQQQPGSWWPTWNVVGSIMMSLGWKNALARGIPKMFDVPSPTLKGKHISYTPFSVLVDQGYTKKEPVLKIQDEFEGHWVKSLSTPSVASRISVASNRSPALRPLSRGETGWREVCGLGWTNGATHGTAPKATKFVGSRYQKVSYQI